MKRHELTTPKVGDMLVSSDGSKRCELVLAQLKGQGIWPDNWRSVDSSGRLLGLVITDWHSMATCGWNRL